MTVPSVARGPVGIVLLGFAFVLLALATRLPFRDTTLFISDSGRYAMALERYDITVGRPHPPGNPLYVALAKAIDAVVKDPPASLALLSALLSGVAFLFAYLLGRDVGGEPAGWLAAGILAVSPLFWFFGGIAMPSTGEAALSLLVAWVARRAREPHSPWGFWTLTILLGLAFGYRSTFAVLVAPLWLYAGWRHPKGRLMAGAAVLVASWFGWTAIVASLSGGMAAYRETTASFFTDVVLGTKILGGGWEKIPHQATAMGASAILGLGLFLLPFVVGLVSTVAGRPPFPGAGPFLATWALPTLAFHTIYDWAPRFGVLLLAPAAILAATTAVPLARRWFEGRRPLDPTAPVGPLARAFVVAGLALNLALFLLPVRFGDWRLPDPYPSGTRLLERNVDLARRDAVLKSSAPDPGSTLVLAYDHAFHVAWFLPEYRVVGLFPLFKDAADAWVPSFRDRALSYEPGSRAVPVGNPLRLPDEVRRIVVYDADYVPLWPPDAPPLREVVYDPATDRKLWTAELPGPGCLAFGFRSLRYLPAGSGGCAP
jgi:hypothetical protein